MSLTSLTKIYDNLPITGRWGCGNNSFMFIVDDETLGVNKYEIFADSWDMAVYILSCQLGINVVEFYFVNSETMHIGLYGYPQATCLLWSV